MSAFRPRHTGPGRTRIQVESGARTMYRAVAPPLLGFVRSADPTVVHLSYRALHEVCSETTSTVTTLCGEQIVTASPDSRDDAPPPCPMCLDTAMNDTASSDTKAS